MTDDRGWDRVPAGFWLPANVFWGVGDGFTNARGGRGLALLGGEML